MSVREGKYVDANLVPTNPDQFSALVESLKTAELGNNLRFKKIMDIVDESTRLNKKGKTTAAIKYFIDNYNNLFVDSEKKEEGEILN